MLNEKGLSEHEKIDIVVFLCESSDIKLWKKWCKDYKREQDVKIISHSDKDVLNLLDHYRTSEPIEAVDALMVPIKV